MSESAEPQKAKLTYERFDLSQRIEHVVFLVSFSVLGITGLAQKYAQSFFGSLVLAVFGGIDTARQIHHISAVVMMISTAYHILILTYKIYVLRVPWTMFPVLEDLNHLYTDVMFYFGMRKHRAYYGRYNYAEKVEYLAVVWGTIIMGLTGFMMWNPVFTARYLPGEAIPAAKAAHSGEALLAVLAIILWHFYHVHIRHFNKSMFIGHMTEEEMAHEHPAELAEIKSGSSHQSPPLDVLRRRQRIYFPVAAVMTITMSLAVYGFLTVESTAITTFLPGETVRSFSPLTPTLQTSPVTQATATPIVAVRDLTWENSISSLFRNRCSTCHAVTKVGGLSLSSYAEALSGGDNGPGIVPGNPSASLIIIVQRAGGHPGQISDAELQQVTEWIISGAAEK